MHTIQIFILRLWIDSETPEQLRGALQSVTEGDVQPFADEQALIMLLRQQQIQSIEKESES